MPISHTHADTIIAPKKQIWKIPRKTMGNLNLHKYITKLWYFIWEWKAVYGWFHYSIFDGYN